MEGEKLDGLLMTLIQQSQGIDGLFKNFFSFLRRRTDFFASQGILLTVPAKCKSRGDEDNAETLY